MSDSSDSEDNNGAKKTKSSQPKPVKEITPEQKKKDEERKALMEKLKRMKELLKQKKISTNQHKKELMKEANLQ